MSGEDRLLESIANTTADYRKGEIDAPTPEHVQRWVNQFDPDVRLPILQEMDHVLKKLYFSRDRANRCLENLYQAKKIVGEDPCAFWKNAKFLDIQLGGASQKEILASFNSLLKEKCNLEIDDCGDDTDVFVYLDDGIFTGNRVIHDLEKWIQDSAPNKATIYVIVAVGHSYGMFYAEQRIKDAANNANKNIKLLIRRSITLEDRKSHTEHSDVLRPVCIPGDPSVEMYEEKMTYKPRLRKAGKQGRANIFSSEEGRQVLEQEFLKKGVYIREKCPYLIDIQRPLGLSTLETLGFGSLFVTFRNCPNNAPLVLWVGDPWYPLFPRLTNTDTASDNLANLFEAEDS